MDAQTLSKAMGGSLSLKRYRELLPHVEQAMIASKATTVERAAMWLAQTGTESLGLLYMEEIASGAAYEGRCKDLGNCYPGDGRRFKGRGPIQLTGRSNYTACSRWGYANGHFPTRDFIVDHPEKLEELRYAFKGVIWYWTQARNMNKFADRRDIRGATRAVNGGYNGLADRERRWKRCLALGDAILPKGAEPEVVLASAGMSVKEVQELVGVTADGIAGPATAAAIKETQAALGITADGIVGKGTATAMASIVDTVNDLKKRIDSLESRALTTSTRVPLGADERKGLGGSKLKSITIPGYLKSLAKVSAQYRRGE